MIDDDYFWDELNDGDTWNQEIYENEQFAQDGFLENPDYIFEEIWHDEHPTTRES